MTKTLIVLGAAVVLYMILFPSTPQAAAAVKETAAKRKAKTGSTGTSIREDLVGILSRTLASKASGAILNLTATEGPGYKTVTLPSGEQVTIAS